MCYPASLVVKPEITIYGFGYVGQAVWRFLRDHYGVQIYDPNQKGAAAPVVKNRAQLKPTPYAIVCVPTPTGKDGACDTSTVEEVIRQSSYDFYLIKSTVSPGTTKQLSKKTGKKIAFSPEYIGEGKYEVPFWKDYPHPTDMKLHQFHIFGGERPVTREWVNIWQKVAGWGPVYAQTDSTTAELVKYMENAFLATKKIFCDEFYNIAKVLGVDYNELKELCLLDGRMGRAMTLVYPESRGFGGKCLPKDVSAIVKRAEEAGYQPQFLKQVLASNKKFRQGK
jgi:UDPglucose 6-dehydrogenase